MGDGGIVGIAVARNHNHACHIVALCRAHVWCQFNLKTLRSAFGHKDLSRAVERAIEAGYAVGDVEGTVIAGLVKEGEVIGDGETVAAAACLRGRVQVHARINRAWRYAGLRLCCLVAGILA